MQPLPLFWKLPIRSKLVLLITGTSLAVLLLSITAFLAIQHRHARRVLIRDTATLGRLIADRSTAGLVFDDPTVCTENLAALKSMPSVQGAAIFREDGSLAAQFRAPLAAPVARAADLPIGTHHFLADSLMVQEPILLEGKPIGIVCIRNGMEELKTRSRQYLASAFGILLIGGLVAFMLSAWLQRAVSGPISKLTDTARAISTRQDFSHRAEKVSDDELGVLVEAFNAMLEQIHQRDMILQGANERLEAQVLTRTAELLEAKERAEESDRLKSAFLATMSHELRTPLNSIIGFTSILLQGMVGNLNPEQEKQLRMVKDSSHHLLNLINEVLDLSKIEAGQLRLNPDSFDLVGVLERALHSTRPLAEKKGLALELKVEGEIPWIVNDPQRAEQVFLNLLSNAIKFTPTGAVVASCARCAEGVLVSVKDTGIGIAPEDLERLFRPFSQLQTGLSRSYDGSGLGLSICKRLLDLMGGRISVESAPGHGSTFSYTLPLRLKP